MRVVLEASAEGWRATVWHAYAGDLAPASLVLPVPADANAASARAVRAEALSSLDDSFGPVVTAGGCRDLVMAVPSSSVSNARAVRLERFAHASEIAAMPAGSSELDGTPGIAWWRIEVDPTAWPRRADGSVVPDAITFTFTGDPARVVLPLRAALFDPVSRELVVDVVASGGTTWSGAHVAPVPSRVEVDSSVRLGFPAFYGGFLDTVLGAMPGPTVLAEFASADASQFRTRIDVHSMQTDAVLVVGSVRAEPTRRLTFEISRPQDGGGACEHYGLPIEGTTSSPRHRFDIARVVQTPIPGVIHAASPLVAGFVRTAEREIVRESQTRRQTSRSCGCDVRSSRSRFAALGLLVALLLWPRRPR
jgi:hypothetical protein